MRIEKTALFGSSLGKCLLLGLSVVLLSSCRLLITTDEKGYIVSASGSHDCDQSACEITITEEFTETFRAVAADGFRFVAWEGVCVRSPTEVCELILVPLPEELAEYDGDADLSAIFESSSIRRAWYRDQDGDDYGTPTLSKLAYEQPDGFVINQSDCDDTDENIHPWTKELEDNRDNNCNGRIDEGYVDVRFYIDRDGDGFGNAKVSKMSRRRPAGYVRNKLDCNDTSADDNPNAEEVQDNRDNNCDGIIDEGGTRYYRDVDGDGFGVLNGAIESLQPIAGYVQNFDDCDDSNSDIYPGASELYDSADNDCDGSIDEGFTARNYYRDADGDGFGDRFDSVRDIETPEGYVLNSTDNCTDISNPTQSDIDRDGIGDACDPVDNSVPDPDPDPGGGGGSCSLTADDQAMLDAVNTFRAQTRVCGDRGSFPGVTALLWSCKLKAAALGHSADMANNDFFSHTGTSGSSPGDRATEAGYTWSTYGENIAAGIPLSSVSAVVQGWIDSPGHCANMMGPNFTNLGAAKYSSPSSTYTLYWTQMFGRPR